MQEVQISDLATHLESLLEAVEQGATIVITRRGRPIARLVPDEHWREADAATALAELDQLRMTMPRLSLQEILSARHEGHKY